ncbi:formate dehydrogenase subunit gamma [Vibrio sp. UCD-FRSSP16_10]|uniref:formate dehydrogenase subunit gamma n=1 Tax=unclassified Vibrio TaxID=2614977 RepID=UPI000801E452|nr:MULTISPECIES: formate dehydrogenase subunit gamma [unclassified Vibrio]OBT13402.1 formate dehydrogenase subunit gamma [Vibrio sp. UCD-FRSSP16_10]OBT17912.1 formate dehydrogenase subunit gamma [Vibrio sp. UCD-FRSSP16_30]
MQLAKQWSLLLLMALASVLMLVSTPSHAEQKADKTAQKEMVQLAGADYWREVKAGVEGTTTSASPEHGILISVPGQTWFILKEKWMSPAAAVAIFGSIMMVVLMYFLVGPLMLSKPRTGRRLNRWSRMDRALHWTMAFTFLTLAFSGLMLVYGKHFLKPYIPSDLWGLVIYAAKQYHNYIGPIFYILLVFIFVKWWRKSIFNKTDVQWFMKMGGMIGKHKGSHPSAGFSNGGEKVIYWLLIVFGVVVATSGVILDFPIFGQTRRDMEVANLVHMISALVLICGFVFHIYIGLVGMEGALEGMVTGKVDETWAKEHHDQWFAEVKHQLEDTPVKDTSKKSGVSNE